MVQWIGVCYRISWSQSWLAVDWHIARCSSGLLMLRVRVRSVARGVGSEWAEERLDVRDGRAIVQFWQRSRLLLRPEREAAGEVHAATRALAAVRVGHEAMLVLLLLIRLLLLLLLCERQHPHARRRRALAAVSLARRHRRGRRDTLVEARLPRHPALHHLHRDGRRVGRRPVPLPLGRDAREHVTQVASEVASHLHTGTSTKV